MTSPANILEHAQSAFECGDFATARRLCRDLDSVGDPDLRRQADALKKKMSSDVVEVVLITGCFLFFAWTVWRYFL